MQTQVPIELDVIDFPNSSRKYIASQEKDVASTTLTILDWAHASIEAGSVCEGLRAVFQGLRNARKQMSSECWAEFADCVRRHAVHHAVYQDPLTLRALQKPRGYAGDAVMMDYLYGVHSALQAKDQASPLGREIFHYLQGMPAAIAVRYRREHIAQWIDRIAGVKAYPSILGIASGHLREAEISEALASGDVGQFVALDADAASLREVETHYSSLGVKTLHGSVRQILARKIDLGSFDFVYAAGLYDYLTAKVAQRLTTRMFEMLKPGGILLIPNFMPEILDRAYMETFMDWTLIYRDEYDMASLTTAIDPTQIESYDVYSDPATSVVYLLVKKVVD